MDETQLTAREELEERILESAPRMGRKDSFRFACHPGVPCFGDCCGNVNIFLTPYDVLRLKNRLGMPSPAFLEKHTILPGDGRRSMPAPVLRMNDDEKRSCPFLGKEGCAVYEDRPWACRMYPLGYAAPPDGEKDAEPFFFLVKEAQCKGFAEDRTISVEEWIADQEIDGYDRSGELYREFADGDRLEKWKEEDPRKVQMFFMATYDLDTFRRFVFETTFLDRFELPEGEIERMRTDDEALMAFAFRWLKFSLLGKRTLAIKGHRVPEHSK